MAWQLKQREREEGNLKDACW